MTPDTSFPRYFMNPEGFTSDAIYIRHDDADEDCVVVTTKGERAPNAPFWSLVYSLLMVERNKAREITKREADDLLDAAILAEADKHH